MERKALKDTKLGAWFRNKAPQVFDAIGEVIPDGGALQAIGALIDASTESEEEKKQARMLLIELENEDRASARQREVDVTKVTGQTRLDASHRRYCCDDYRGGHGHLGDDGDSRQRGLFSYTRIR